MTDNAELLEFTADLVAAYVVNNAVPVADIPQLIRDVHAALAKLAGASVPEAQPVAVPAVNPKKSVFPDYLISLEDGKQYKMLRRHLSTRGLTPDEYRLKWKLPSDYPMTAANYSVVRSAVAKSAGLGQKAKSKRQ